MAELTKTLSEENAELSVKLRSWSKNCGKLRNQNHKLEVTNKKLNAENAELKSRLDKNAALLQGYSKDTKYVMQLLEKSNLKNEELSQELCSTRNGCRDKESEKLMLVKQVHDQSTMTEDMHTDWKEEIRYKDEAISFYKEVCDAKVVEVAELQRFNRFLKNKIQQNN